MDTEMSSRLKSPLKNYRTIIYKCLFTIVTMVTRIYTEAGKDIWRGRFVVFLKWNWKWQFSKTKKQEHAGFFFFHLDRIFFNPRLRKFPISQPHLTRIFLDRETFDRRTFRTNLTW